jgi:glutamine synthetase
MSNKSNFTFSDLETWFNERRVTEIECLVPDLTAACACPKRWSRWA